MKKGFKYTEPRGRTELWFKKGWEGKGLRAWKGSVFWKKIPREGKER